MLVTDYWPVVRRWWPLLLLGPLVGALMGYVYSSAATPLYRAQATIFVTVDPERDTLPVLGEYLAGYDKDVIGLVGTPEQTEAAKAAFGAQSEKASDDEFYLVNHTASVFLINADGRFEGTIAYGEARETAIAKIKKLLDG